MTEMFSRITHIFILMVIAPVLAQACSGCFTTSGKSLDAYYTVTIFLTLLPLVIGGVIYVAVKCFRE